MLLALKRVESFLKFFLNAFITMFIGSSFIMLWFLLANVKGVILFFFAVGFIMTAPFVGFYFIRRTLGWRAALWSMPFIWVVCDWLHHSAEGTFGGLGIGVTQSKLYWLIQYIDIFGMWAIAFWLVLFNVLVVIAIEDWQAAKVSLNDARAARRFLRRRLSVVAAAMLIPPLAYSAYLFIKTSRSASDARNEISVLMVQPNVDPWSKTDQRGRAATLGRTLSLTDSALTEPKPDLIIWPETAVPYVFLHEKNAREFVYKEISKWNVPLLTGTLDARTYSSKSERPPLLQYENRNYEVFNSALMLTPEPEPAAGGFSVKCSDVYHKRNLMPFVERVPFVDRFPFLSRLAVDLGAGSNLGIGNEPTVFSFVDKQGRTITIASPICYEHLYPAKIAELVRNGAQALAVISNEGWFSKSHGEYQLAAFTILRSIEMRRAIARCTNTGLTCFIDQFGRVYEQAPWWSEQALIGKMQLSSEMSFYVRHPDSFSKVCGWIVLAIGAAAIIQKARQYRRSLRRLASEVQG